MTFSETVHDILNQAADERWPYPQVFDALKAAGVRFYTTDVARYVIEYVGDAGRYREAGSTDSDVNIVSTTFSSDGIESAIARTQAGEIDYTGFLKAIAAAGVAGYRVDMAARTVTYHSTDKRHAHVQHIPAS